MSALVRRGGCTYASGACLARLGVPPALSVRYVRVNGFGKPTPPSCSYTVVSFCFSGYIASDPTAASAFSPFWPSV